MDAADFKTYVFPLLFFKRISDVHGEEYQSALTESGGDEEYARFPQNYRFQIPDDSHWDDVRTVASNVGQALQRAMRAIEKANPETLYGIFGDASWTNKDHSPIRCSVTSSSISPASNLAIRPRRRTSSASPTNT